MTLIHIQPLLNLVNGSLNSPLPHLDIIKLLHKTLFHKVHHLVLANSDQTWRKSLFKTIISLPLLSQPKAFISNFGWFCCLTEHILKFIFDLSFIIRKEYKTVALFHLCQLILFIWPTKNFIFHLLCPKYSLLLQWNCQKSVKLSTH